MMNKPLALFTMGRTAVGKTTLAQGLSKTLDALYVPEGAIKRLFRNEYKTEDSLDEDLRDIGYRAAIAAWKASLDFGKSAILDAAFHRKQRRRWLYNAISKNNCCLVVLYCCCDSEEKIRKRIANRKRLPKSAYTQADSMSIFNFIDSQFEEPTRNELSFGIPAALFTIDTNRNMITSSEHIVYDGNITASTFSDIESLIASLLQNFKSMEP